jgi:hypothetical protein
LADRQAANLHNANGDLPVLVDKQGRSNLDSSPPSEYLTLADLGELLLLVGMTASFAQADGFDYWTNQFPSVGNPAAVGAGDNLIIAREGWDSRVYSSTNGRDWLQGGTCAVQGEVVGHIASGVAIGHDKVVTVGGPSIASRILILTYGDGRWQVTRMIGDQFRAYGTYYQVAYGAGTFVAVGGTGPVNEPLLSGDGIGWGRARYRV